MQNFPEVRRIPNAYAAGIGRVISRWAYLEWLLTDITYGVLNIGPKQGRMVVRDVRAYERVEMIRDLMKLRKIATTIDMNRLMDDLDAAEKDRNLLAHGMWIKHPSTGELHVWFIRGAWRPDPKQQKVSRNIKPQAVRKTPADLTARYKDIDRLIGELRNLQTEVVKAVTDP
jgi:hypothetical protein